MIIYLPIRSFEKGEEHFPIDFYFHEGRDFEIAVLGVIATKRLLSISDMSTNILEYNICNPDMVLARIGPYNLYRIAHPKYFNIAVGSLKNLRIKLTNFDKQPVAITLIIREING